MIRCHVTERLFDVYLVVRDLPNSLIRLLHLYPNRLIRCLWLRALGV